MARAIWVGVLLWAACGCESKTSPLGSSGPSTASGGPAGSAGEAVAKTPPAPPKTPVGWNRFTTPDGRISIDMPGTVTPMKTQAQSAHGPVTMEICKARSGTVFYNVFVSHMPEGAQQELREPGAFRERIQKSWLAQKKGEEISFRGIPDAPVPAFEQEFRYTTQQKTADNQPVCGRERVQSFHVDDGIITLLVDVLAPAGEIDRPNLAPEVDAFFGSLKLDAKGPPANELKESMRIRRRFREGHGIVSSPGKPELCECVAGNS